MTETARVAALAHIARLRTADEVWAYVNSPEFYAALAAEPERRPLGVYGPNGQPAYRKDAAGKVTLPAAPELSVTEDGECPECFAGIESGDGHNEGCPRRTPSDEGVARNDLVELRAAVAWAGKYPPWEGNEYRDADELLVEYRKAMLRKWRAEQDDAARAAERTVRERAREARCG